MHAKREHKLKVEEEMAGETFESLMVRTPNLSLAVESGATRCRRAEAAIGALTRRLRMLHALQNIRKGEGRKVETWTLAHR
mmetsp:Transcript_11440/g.70272  ORF Transcript_11440/g.70272 Transcript_11440/m.70272 type:complete len:81 (+) Transcript_11440:311-553(+)